jgi:hypothetical protein
MLTEIQEIGAADEFANRARLIPVEWEVNAGGAASD